MSASAGVVAVSAPAAPRPASPAPTSDAPQGRPRDSRLDGALLEATVLLLEEKGYAALTTAAVAQRAGVSTASLYRRWASKEELVATAAAVLIADFAVDHNTGSLDGDLTALLETKVAILRGRTGSVLRSLAGRATHDQELAGIIERDVYGLARGHVTALLARAVERGDVRQPVGAALATDLILGMVVVPLFLAADGPAAVAAIDVPASVAVLRRALGA